MHYNVSDSTGEYYVLFFDCYAIELLGSTAEQLKKKLEKDGKPHSFPNELSDCNGKELHIKLRLKQYNIEHLFSSMTVTLCTTDPHMLVCFTYSDDQGLYFDLALHPAMSYLSLFARSSTNTY
ncbi:hypothetical protein K1719_001411 [Acacia pycnantha]|nr:hypothetical protein K1719_001411 [Acacia pycnantha]